LGLFRKAVRQEKEILIGFVPSFLCLAQQTHSTELASFRKIHAVPPRPPQFVWQFSAPRRTRLGSFSQNLLSSGDAAQFVWQSSFGKTACHLARLALFRKIARRQIRPSRSAEVRLVKIASRLPRIGFVSQNVMRGVCRFGFAQLRIESQKACGVRSGQPACLIKVRE